MAKNDEISRLMKAGADSLFPSLLSQDEMEAIHRRRVKKAEKLKKQGIKVKSKMLDVTTGDYIIRGGGLDDSSRDSLVPTDDFDIGRYMADMEDPDTGTLHDLKIDLRDLPLAKNFYDYCFNLSGKKMHAPWSRQLWIGAMTFGEVCPCCTNPKWLDIHNVPKDFKSKDMPEHMVFLENGKCPKCKRTKWELIQHHGLRNYIQLVNVLGQRSGKSSSLATYASYHLHRILKFPNYASLTKTMQASTELTGTFVSLSFAKAIGVMWTPFRKIVTEESAWFKSYFEKLDYYKGLYGKELYRTSTLYMTFGLKNLRMYPSGPKASTLRGDCLVGTTMINTSKGFVHFNELGFARGFTEVQDVVDSPYGRKAVSHTYKKVDRTTVKVKTRNGYSLQGTPEHPVLTIQPDLSYKWVRLDELIEGDWIVSRTKKNEPLFGNSTVTKDQATIMGTFLANGFRNGISSDDYKVIKRFKAAVKREGYTVRSKWSTDLTKRASYHWVLTGTQGKRSLAYSFEDVLESWGYAGVPSAKKSIPLSIRTAPKVVLHEFLEAYFACDSGINGGATAKARAAGRTTSAEIELSSASLKLIRQLQVILLQAYGIVGRLHKRVEYKNMSRVEYKEKQYVTWILTLSGIDAWAFSQKFKRAKIQKYADRIKYVPPGYGSDRRNVPYLKSVVSKFWASLGNTPGQQYFVTPEGARIKRPSKPRFINGRGDGLTCPEFLIYENRSKDFEKFLTSMDPSLGTRVTEIFDLEAHYEEVVSVRNHEKKVTVYDVTVPDGHCFTANGLASHNTRIFAALDELGLFKLPTGDDQEDENSEIANADEAHKSLMNSLTTVNLAYNELLAKGYNTAPPAILMSVSSPMSQRDKVMRLLRESRTEKGAHFILGINLPTWEVNPTMTRETPVIANAYASNPEKAERDFGANPPMIHSRFITPEQIKEGLFINGQNSHKLIHHYDEPGLIYGKLQKVRVFPYPSVVAMDAGSVNNSFAIAAGHYDFDKQKTVVTTLLECTPQEGRRIDFNMLYQHVILPLCQDLYAVGVAADQWQSIDLLHRIKADMGNNPLGKPKTLSTQYSLKRSDFNSFRAMIDNKTIILPSIAPKDLEYILGYNIVDYRKELKDRPVDHTALQMITVRDVGETRCPEKGEDFTDDIFRALVLLVNKIHNPKIMERLQEARPWVKANPGSAMPRPVYVSRGGMRFPLGLR